MRDLMREREEDHKQMIESFKNQQHSLKDKSLHYNYNINFDIFQKELMKVKEKNSQAIQYSNS